MSSTPKIPTVCTIDALPSNGLIISRSTPVVYTVGDTVEHGKTIDYICKHGYKSQGDDKRVCFGGQWMSEAPICEPKGAYLIDSIKGSYFMCNSI